MEKYSIVQGDAYVLPIVITAGNVLITDQIATAVRIKVGKYSAIWPGGKISYSAGKWLFPLTQEQTQNLSPGKDEYQVQVQFSGGETIGTKPAPIGVIKSVLRGTFGEELAVAASKNIVELKQLNAYISDVDINVSGGGSSPYSVLFVPQTLSDDEKEQARENIGAGTPYSLPRATETVLGGIKLGNGLVTDNEGKTGIDSDILSEALPKVDEKDDGKILTVVGGKWTATENTGGGGDIPEDVITLDNLADIMGANLEYTGGKINVLTASAPEADNTKPITAAAVQETVGNINILLGTI